jgi:hypothetical protein
VPEYSANRASVPRILRAATGAFAMAAAVATLVDLVLRRSSDRVRKHS